MPTHAALLTVFILAGTSEAGPVASPASTPVPVASATPVSIDPGITGLESLLEGQDPVANGGSGSFGYRLTSLGVNTYLKAYATAEWFNQDDQPNTFDMHYFNVFVGADIQGKIFPEIQLEHEHTSAPDGSEIRIRFAQVDLKLHRFVTLRVGNFLVPMGSFNEFLYPEFINHVPDRPFVFQDGIIPEAWHESGVQLRGRIPLGRGMRANYSAYLVNGLVQTDDPLTPGVDNGGLISYDAGFISPAADPTGDKSFGGRLGFEPITGIGFGASGYYGAYTVDGKRHLAYLDADFSMERKGITVWAEAVRVREETTGSTIIRQGGYVQVAYRIQEFIEPVVQFDAIRFDDPLLHDKDRWTGGVNLYPYPHDNPAALVKVSYATSKDHQKPDAEDDKFSVQFAIGF